MFCVVFEIDLVARVFFGCLVVNGVVIAWEFGVVWQRSRFCSARGFCEIWWMLTRDELICVGGGQVIGVTRHLLVLGNCSSDMVVFLSS